MMRSMTRVAISNVYTPRDASGSYYMNRRRQTSSPLLAKLGGPSRTEVAQAFFSVYLHAGRSPAVAEKTAPMSLDDAVRILRTGVAELTVSRRTRARTALESSKFKERFVEQIRLLRSAVDPVVKQAPVPAAATLAAAAPPGPAPMCSIVGKPKLTLPSGDPSGSQSIRIELLLKSSEPGDPLFFERVRRGLDPQSWNECCTFFGGPDFDGAYLAEPDGGGDYDFGTDPCTGEPPPAAPQPLGTGWGEGVLFERFGYVGSPGISITNLLDVRTTLAGSTYTASYALRTAECAMMDTDKDFKLVIDAGTATATAEGDNVRVVSVKTIGWDAARANAKTQLLFNVMGSSLPGELVDIACCENVW